MTILNVVKAILAYCRKVAIFPMLFAKSVPTDAVPGCIAVIKRCRSIFILIELTICLALISSRVSPLESLSGRFFGPDVSLVVMMLDGL